MVSKVTVSSKNQIAVPAEIRKQLGIKRGDKLLLTVVDGTVVMLPEPKDYNEYIGGLHKEIWEGIEATDYVRQEREAWQE